MRIGARRASLRTVVGLLVTGIGLAALSGTLAAQQTYIRGQNVQPAYEGWDQNPDGSYNLYFGYLNRNLEETPTIPIGASNTFSPGPADQGQPTYFYPRRQMFVFKIRVPADFGDQELVWTVTHNGRTDRAVGWLAPFYEFDNTVFRSQRTGTQRESTAEELKAQPPSIEAGGPVALTTPVGTPLKLSVLVKDDGFPGPNTRRYPQPGGESDITVPLVRHKSMTEQDVVRASLASKTGLAVTFIRYRGPGEVTFAPMTVELDKLGGQATTTLSFSEPGTYVIRAVANDQIFTTPINFTVTVTGTATTSAP